MKRTVLFVALVIFASLMFNCASTSGRSSLFGDQPAEPDVNQVDPTTVAPAPGSTVVATPEESIETPAATSEVEVPPATGPISFAGENIGTGPRTVDIEFLPSGHFGSQVDSFYVTFDARFRERTVAIQPTNKLRFENISPGTYYLNFRWHTSKRWVVENDPPVNGTNRDINGILRVRINGGPWHYFSRADTEKVGGQFWNLRLVVP